MCCFSQQPPKATKYLSYFFKLKFVAKIFQTKSNLVTVSTSELQYLTSFQPSHLYLPCFFFLSFSAHSVNHLFLCTLFYFHSLMLLICPPFNTFFFSFYILHPFSSSTSPFNIFFFLLIFPSFSAFFPLFVSFPSHPSLPGKGINDDQ